MRKIKQDYLLCGILFVQGIISVFTIMRSFAPAYHVVLTEEELQDFCFDADVIEEETEEDKPQIAESSDFILWEGAYSVVVDYLYEENADALTSGPAETLATLTVLSYSHPDAIKMNEISLMTLEKVKRDVYMCHLWIVWVMLSSSLLI